MDEQERSERAAVVAEAMSWQNTRYHHMGRLKATWDELGRPIEVGGVDCAQLIYMVFHAVGLTPDMPLYPYSPQEFLNRDEQKFLNEILGRAHRTNNPLPGDCVMYWHGKAFGHGGIIIEPGWPNIIHANQAAGRVITDDGTQGQMARRKHIFLTIWGEPCPLD